MDARSTSEPTAAQARRRTAAAALAAGILAAGALSPLAAHASPPSATTSGAGPAHTQSGGVAGLPDGMPEAALAAEPALPMPAAWGFSEGFPRTSGTSRLDSGALLWTDWLYDDTGAGMFTYSGENTGSNGADIFRAGVAADGEVTRWRVDWNTLIDPDVPIAAWTFDTDSDESTGAAEWPAAAGATSPGIDAALVMSSRGAWLVDAVSGKKTDVRSAGGEVIVDEAARSFVVTVPRSALAIEGSWVVRLAAGVANADGTEFAPAPEAPQGTRIYNAAFRDLEDEPHLVGGTRDASTEWNNGRQTESLTTGDMSDFAIDVDWTQLLSGTTTAEPMPTGYSTRWFVSSVEIAQGRDPAARRSPGPALQPATFWGRVQPYTVYVPTDYAAGTPAPLTILLHGGNGNHNSFAGDHKDEVYTPMCEERGSICVSPLGRGLSSWYVNHGELDVWEVWNRASTAYTLDSERTVIAGFSMGGVGTTRFVTNHPDVFAAAAIVSGAGYYNSAGQRDREGAQLRLENLSNGHTFMDSGSRDIALANTQRWDRTAEAAGIPYRAHYYEGADHGMLGTRIGWSDIAEYVSDATRTVDPASIVFRWEPADERADLGIPIDDAYWLSGLDPRDDTARWSRVGASSLALKTTALDPVLTDEVRVIDGRNVQVRDQRLVAAGDVTPRNEVELTAENVATMTLDLAAAGIDPSAPARASLTTDGEIELSLHRDGEVATVTLAAGDHVLTGPDAPTSVRGKVIGNNAVRIFWSPAASDLPLIGYTVRDASGEVVCETRAVTCRVDGKAGVDEVFTVTAANILGSSEAAGTGAIKDRGK